MNSAHYRQASFRGIPFHAQSTSSEVAGRRAAVHEYAGRDESYPEDLGLKAKSFTLSAYVIGKTYQDKRDALIDACTKKGPGELIHPYHGTLQVLCTGCSVSEGTDQGLMASFSLSFALAPTKSSFVSRPDTGVIAKNYIKAFDAMAKEAFLAGYIPGRMPSFASLDLMETAAKVDELLSDVDALIDTFNPANIIKNVQSFVGELTFNEALKITGDVLQITAPLATSQAGQKVMSLASELTTFVSRQSLAKSATYLTEKAFISSNEAINDFFSVDRLIEAELETSSFRGEANLFFAGQDMRYSLGEHIKKTAVHLPKLENVLVTQTDASLPIAYKLTGNADNANDFAKRNALKHPSFSHGGERYEVLNG